VYPTADTLFLISRYLGKEFLENEEEHSVLLGCFWWLLKVRNDKDGGWSQYAITKEDASVVDSTAWAIRALVAYTKIEKIEKIPDEAREHLKLLLDNKEVCDSLIKRMSEAMQVEGNKETKWSFKWETIEWDKEKEKWKNSETTYNWFLNNYEKEHTLEILKILLARRAIDWLIENQNIDYGWGLYKCEDSRVYSTFISLLAIRESINKTGQVLSEKASKTLQDTISKGLEWLQKKKEDKGCRMKNGWTYYRETERNIQPEMPNVPSTCQALIALLSNNLKPYDYRLEMSFLVEPFVRGSKELPKGWETEEEIYRLTNGFDVRLSWFSLPFLIWTLTFFVKASMLSITDFLRICQYLELFVTKDGKVSINTKGTEVRTWAVCHYLIARLEAREMIQGNEVFINRFTEFTIYPDIVEDVGACHSPIRFFRGAYASDRFLNLALCLGTIGTCCAIVLIQIKEGIPLLPYFLGVPAVAGFLYLLKSLVGLKLGYFGRSYFRRIQLPISALCIGTPIAISTKFFEDPRLIPLGVIAILVGLFIPVHKIIEDLERLREKAECNNP